MYIIQEIQTNNGLSALTPATQKTDWNEAQNVYHTALAAAAVSSVQIHTVICIDEYGNHHFGSPLFYTHMPEMVEG